MDKIIKTHEDIFGRSAIIRTFYDRPWDWRHFGKAPPQVQLLQTGPMPRPRPRMLILLDLTARAVMLDEHEKTAGRLCREIIRTPRKMKRVFCF